MRTKCHWTKHSNHVNYRSKWPRQKTFSSLTPPPAWISRVFDPPSRKNFQNPIRRGGADFFSAGTTHFVRMPYTVPLRRNLTGNVNRHRTDTERVWEREWNRYRMGTERIQNAYRTDIERISNGYGTVTDQKKGKKHSGTQTIRERVLQNTC